MMYNNIMNTIEYSFKFPIQVLSDRITIALSNLGLNEFYAAFKYLRDILKNILEKKDDSHESIKDSVTIVQNKYGITFRTLINSLNKIFYKCPIDDDALKVLIAKRLNFYIKIKALKEYTIKEISKSSMYN